MLQRGSIDDKGKDTSITIFIRNMHNYVIPNEQHSLCHSEPSGVSVRNLSKLSFRTDSIMLFRTALIMSFRTNVRNLSPEGYLRISPVGRNDRRSGQNDKGNTVILNGLHYVIPDEHQHCHSEQPSLCHSERM